MKPLMARGLWDWIDENRASFEPPVGNKVIWEDSQYTAMIVRGPNARRDFHIDPSDEIFFQLRGDIVVETLDAEGHRRSDVIREGELFLVPSMVPHAPHRPRDTWGLVVEIKRRPDQTESLVWLCDQCDARVHEITMHVADIETELKTAIETFNTSEDLRTCPACGHIQADTVSPIEPPE